jgi:hypothetical protein
MIRIILYAAIAILVLFAIKFFKLMSNYKSASRPSVDDLKEKAANLKNKYKNIQEADFRDIISSEDENDSTRK